MGAIACQCKEKAGLHITSHSHRTETINGQEKNVFEEEGELVITSLTNYAMPFIRYRIGDRGKLTAKQCSCGRCFPLLESVSGRIIESFITAKGEFVSPIYMITMMGTSFKPGTVKKFQIVQEDYSHIVVKIAFDHVRSQEYMCSHCDQISGKIRSVMGEACTVSYEFVDDIPRSSSGKYLYTICRILQNTSLVQSYKS